MLEVKFFISGKLTNPAFAAQLLEEMNNTDTKSPEEAANHLTRSTSVAEAIKQAVSGESLQSMRLKSEKLLSSTLSLVKRDGTEVSLASLLQQVVLTLHNILHLPLLPLMSHAEYPRLEHICTYIELLAY